MRSRMRSGGPAAAVVAVVFPLLIAACGGGDGETARAARPAPAPALASAAAVDADPYAIACGHVGDQQRWAHVTRRATVAIADRERIPRLSRLQATQSIYYAMTEVCKGRPASFAPAEAAVAGVRSGRYRVGGR